MLVGLMCQVRYRIAGLIHLVSIPRLIDFAVDNLYMMIPRSSCAFLFVWSLLGPRHVERIQIDVGG